MKAAHFYSALRARKHHEHENLATAEVLLVEDSPSDARMTRQALENARLLNNLHVVGDGVEAIEFLRHEGNHASAPRPHLILLDLNLPKKSGRKALGEIKAEPQLKMIPVVVLTTSGFWTDNLPKDIRELLPFVSFIGVFTHPVP